MQMPIPQSGPLGSPPIETRHAAPAINIAAATLVSATTRTSLPFTRIVKPSLVTLSLAASVIGCAPVTDR